MTDTQHDDHHGHVEIKVVNEDTGREKVLEAGEGTPIRVLIERLYTLFGLTRQPDDRLRCEGSGEDVFAFTDLHVGEYLKVGHCPDHTWLFAGATGGALTQVPTIADPEIASTILEAHLADLWATGRPERHGWGLIRLDHLHVVVAIPANRIDGTRDWYFVKIGAEYYDLFPPTVAFVNPSDWSSAVSGTRWFPSLNCPSWFHLHPSYQYPDGIGRQLVCFTLSAEYYQTNHSPAAHQVWTKGRHTVAATLYRIEEILNPPYYQGPSA